MKFTKMHGAGNDYLYIDARSQSRDWPALSVAMSDRHTGVGSDGIILMLSSDRADLRMRMFNADGSEGEMCGNGIRCLVRYALDRGIAPPDKTPVSVETLAGVLEVTPIWENGVMSRARVGMGKPILRPEEIPVDLPGQELVMDHPLRVDGHSFDLTFVSMGNPHAVAFIDEPVDDVRLADIGPLVERHALFPQRVNFEICNVLEGSRIKTRVWERGSGITMACGTGACAVAVAARLHGYIGDESTIELP
ncbi:MAG: diaminopimelate epimerase, partial [Chloroflexi bacterium]|nr:diaminopimelate epimerase [Chloroflexota bacterium]